jgi:hypothetical protein
MSARISCQTLRQTGIGRPRVIVGDRDPRHLDDAAFDRVNQREIRDDPGKKKAFVVARAAQKERRRRDVIDGAQIDFPAESFDAVDPQPRGFGVLFRLLAPLRLDRCLVCLAGFLLIAMMRLVIEDDDILAREQFRTDARQHLPLGLLGLRLRAPAL